MIKTICLPIIAAVFSVIMSAAENPSVLYMIGGATDGTWDWDKATEMMPVPGMDGQYSWTGNLAAGDFKIYAEKNPTWNESISFYHPTYDKCKVSEEGVADNKVEFTAGPDYKWDVGDVGQYTITIDIKTLTISATYLGAPVKNAIDTETLFLIGDAAPCGWDINNLTPCTKKEKNVFVYNGTLKGGGGTLQASASQGNWSAKFIVPLSNGCKISKSGVESNDFDYSADHTNTWSVEEDGIYILTFDLNKWTLEVASDSTTGIDVLVNDKDAPVEYYNLQGVRVNGILPGGLYLKRQGRDVSKVMIK